LEEVDRNWDRKGNGELEIALGTSVTIAFKLSKFKQSSLPTPEAMSAIKMDVSCLALNTGGSPNFFPFFRRSCSSVVKCTLDRFMNESANWV
jgi:hypothetical protein